MKVLFLIPALLLCMSWIYKPTEYSKCIVGSWEGSIYLAPNSDGVVIWARTIEFIITFNSDKTLNMEFTDPLDRFLWEYGGRDWLGFQGAYYRIWPTSTKGKYRLWLYADADLKVNSTTVDIEFKNCSSSVVTYRDKREKEHIIRLNK